MAIRLSHVSDGTCSGHCSDASQLSVAVVHQSGETVYAPEAGADRQPGNLFSGQLEAAEYSGESDCPGFSPASWTAGWSRGPNKESFVQAVWPNSAAAFSFSAGRRRH
jgi:hypothetical protein